MHSQIQKWGNSLGVRIPKILAQKLHLQPGSKVELDTINHRLVITKSNSELDLLLNCINSSNCHSEGFDDDSNIGNESW